ncbi:MAG: DNA-directed RNA polymerase I subunit rpa49 [Watsoniomyces obsoletus]|nr:MAG: DNA-directed RNA polymerase I subunit rpa49 [Watsoniomyces obsoletus]
MAPSLWFEDRYRQHFFCALCGGPFARIARTDQTGDESQKPHNEPWSADELRANANKGVGMDLMMASNGIGDGVGVRIDARSSEERYVRPAYDGSLIGDEDIQWTRVLRALIHRHAQVHPLGGRELLTDNSDVYLTGSGRVLQEASWAVAHPSVEDEIMQEEEEEDDEEGEGVDLLDRDRNHCRFHLYQEPDRLNGKHQISSIPVHEECWIIFWQTVQLAQAARRLPVQPMPSPSMLQAIWSYWSNSIAVPSGGRLADLRAECIANGIAADLTTRLTPACMGRRGYREAQACGDGKTWLHVDGLEWLVADPQMNKLPEDPFTPEGMSRSNDGMSAAAAPMFPRRRTQDPFNGVPPEVLVEIMRYLSCAEIFRWRVASTPLNQVRMPQWLYRRVFIEEMDFLPGLMRNMNEHEQAQGGQKSDWAALFDHATRVWRQNAHLRNRRRIWKIVQPMADEIVERSTAHVRRLGGLTDAVSSAITVVRGSVGVPSGVEGRHDTIVFSELFRPNYGSSRVHPIEPVAIQEAAAAGSSTGGESSANAEDAGFLLTRVDIWLHRIDGYVCGLGFYFSVEQDPMDSIPPVMKTIGHRTVCCEHFPVDSSTQTVTGFRVRWAAGHVRGVQLVLEDPRTDPTEFAESEFVSSWFGCIDGPIRRLVAPRRFRTLAGVTAFVSSAGRIETLAILEKKKPYLGADGMLYSPPDTIPLTHQEASLWESLPPNDVDLLDRQGPPLEDWRLQPSQCEIFAPTPQHQPPGVIEAIMPFSDGDYLRGIRFLYKDSVGNRIHRDMGDCSSGSSVKVSMNGSESISLAVIGHGPHGILSLQLVTSSGKVGAACGPRYRGIHTTYAVQSIISTEGREGPGRVVYIDYPIIGFHGLYSPKIRRLVQLGIIVRAKVPRSNQSPAGTIMPSTETAFSSATNICLPFVELDQQSNLWVDGAPPTQFVRGRKRSDPVKTPKVHPLVRYAGWVPLRDPISRMIIYGEMEGIRFSYATRGRSDTCFGNTDARLPQERHIYKSKSPFRAIGQLRPRRGRDDVTSSAETLPSIRLLKVIGRDDQRHRLEVHSDFLAGIEFNFTSSRIVDWRPLFDYSLAKREDQVAVMLQERRDRWKSTEIAERRPEAQIDQDLSRYEPVLTDFFVDEHGHHEVDGVKGYVTHIYFSEWEDGEQRDAISTRFCGLRFRRRGLWDEEPLGQASAFEEIFLLSPGETFVSVVASRQHHPSAIALSTSNGRTTTWFGDPRHGHPVRKSASSGYVAVGIYLAYLDPRQCGAVGIIQDRAAGTHENYMMALDVPFGGFPSGDPGMDIQWVENPPSLPGGYHLQEDFSSDSYPSEQTRRAFTLIEPPDLRRIEAYVNTYPGRYGLKALRFSGDPRMGPVLLGEWEDEFHPSPEQTMIIEGHRGERIVEVEITQKRHKDGPRIIGVVIKTNHGREQDIVTWEPFTDEQPPAEVTSSRRIFCGRGGEVAGFEYLLGVSQLVNEVSLRHVLTRPAMHP